MTDLMTHRSASRVRSLAGSAPALAIAIMLGAAAATVLFVALTNSDALVARGFATALETEVSPGAASQQTQQALVSGSEEFWLTRNHQEGVAPASWSTPLTASLDVSVGDRITVTSGGTKRTLEVIEVSDVPANVTRIDVNDGSQGRRLVVCRDLTAGSGYLVRFLTQPEPPMDASSSATPRVL
jgi:hypothetical protein